MQRYVLKILPFFFSVSVLCQEIRLPEIITNIAEDLAADENDTEATSKYIEMLQELSENPVILNISSENEISRLFFLSDFQVKALADYSQSGGKIVSIYEIANIPGFDKETAEMMIPFISFENKGSSILMPLKWRNTLLTNCSIKHGIDDSSSLGDAWRILTKYKITAGAFSGGVTFEKDPGETFLSGNTSVPDFISANLSYAGNGIIRRIIAGDFSARFGQGTNINTGMRTALSITAPGYLSARDEIKPYTSTDENNFFRGVAAEFHIKNAAISLFYSRNFTDATLGSSTGISIDHIENLYPSGVHNTTSALLKKDAVSEILYGINLSYMFSNIRTGIVWSEEKFSLPFIQVKNDPEGAYDFTGKRNSLYTFYYKCLIKRILFYGEFSTNSNFKFAVVHGLSFRPSDLLTINFLYRNYNEGYETFHGKGPGSSSSTRNERGILGNFSFEAAKHLFISGGCDIHYHPWLTYRCSAPSRGIKKELRTRFLPSEKLTFDAAYNCTLSEVDISTDRGIPGQEEIITKSIKGSVRYSVYDYLTIGTRLDYKKVEPYGSRGFMMLQEAKFRYRKVPVTFWIRYCLFKTDDWYSRIYTYENDLVYSYSIPAFSGEGIRNYIMIEWELSDIAEMRFKYGVTSLSTNEIITETRDEIKLQLRFRF